MAGKVYRNEDGTWGYRFTYQKNGKRKDVRKKGFKTKGEASNRMAEAILKTKKLVDEGKVKTYSITFDEAWGLYLNGDAKSKASGTVQKHRSVWKTHVCERFKDCDMNTVTQGELEDFLTDKYAQGFRHGYVESFLKLFYLLYGVANRHERIDPVKYKRMFLDKETRLKMPKISQSDAENKNRIIIYNSGEIAKINEVMQSGNLYTAFLLAYYCGLRVGEIFGLRWDDVDYIHKTLRIERQMQSEDGVFCLLPLKTSNSYRTIDLPPVVLSHLSQKNNEDAKKQGDDNYKNTELVLDKTKDKKNPVRIIGGDFINRKENGVLQTVHSTKYWADKVKEQTGIDFHFHALRSTHLSQLAGMNVPPIEVMKHAGHSKFDVTMRYYLNTTEAGHDQLLRALHNITTKEKQITYTLNQCEPMTLPESEFLRLMDNLKHIPSTNTDLKIISED